MLRLLTRPAGALGRAPGCSRRASSAASAASEPLRILFCGSDAFGCASLRALHREHERDARLVEALDVLVLPPKPTGRGLKQLRAVPCRAVAEELGLRIHQRDTFRQWELPEGINLIVAVSFGLFVPPRILRAARYGGLNVHPSFLPDLRGPAPIHHAMLRGDTHIGVSLQTLDDTRFDHGTVLAQTPAPGLAMRPDASLDEVTHEAAVVGAQLLVQGLRAGVHVPPHTAVGGLLQAREPPAHAPKLTKADAQVDWARWTRADDWTRRIRVFSSVWTRAAAAAAAADGPPRRVILHDATAVAPGDVRGAEGTVCFVHDGGPGPQEARHERTVVTDQRTGACAVRVGDAAWVRVTRAQVEGKRGQDAATALRPFVRGGDGR